MSNNNDRQARNFNHYIDSILNAGGRYDFRDKKRAIRNHIAYMLNRTQAMFEWKNLPDTIPTRSLELFLQVNGNVCFYEYENNLYVFTGGLGGEPNVYYMPTIYTIANPALKLSKSLKIDVDCVVMPNDSLYVGLLPMLSRYATLLCENELSIKIATVNSRIVDLIGAPDDRTRASAEKFLEDIEAGKPGVIAENAFLDGIRAQPYGGTSNTNAITNLIELEQYLKASMFNELGLNANYNMKRESLNSAESQLNDDALLPFVDNMLKCRQTAVDKVNAMYGTDISVDFASSWKDNIEELDLKHEEMQGDVPEEDLKEGDNNEIQDT